jgi:protein-tyrosine kinase
MTPAGRPDVLVLDYLKLAQLGFVTPDTPRSGVAEEFRVLKRPLLANVSRQAKPVRNANLIMVASAVPGEGKTFTAVNLAMSMAMELDQTVLLVDADVARPSLPSLLGMSSRRGLMDVMLDKTVDLAQVLVKTNIDKLTILPSGSPHRQSTELLASESMTRLLNEMAVRYPDRIIIFDTPPLLFTTEAQALAVHMGQIVLVVQAEATLQRDVKRALATIESCPVKMIVLNQARTVAQGAYGYGYAH